MSGSLAQTSRWMAAARARESRRSDRLFEDPLAEALSGPEGFTWLRNMDLAASTLGAGPGLYSVIRTRFFDDFLETAVSESGARQVVLLAAGMDARAFRMEWPPGTQVYEIDLPEVIAAKDEILKRATTARPAERRTVGADLSGGSWPCALAEAGHDPDNPTIWLAEGVLLYLEEAEVHGLLEGVRGLSAPGSRLGTDFINRDFSFSPSAWPLLEAFSWLGSPLRFGTNEPEDLLARHGWRARCLQPGQKGAEYGRWPYPVPPRGLSGFPRSFLLTGRLAPEGG